MLTEVEEVMTKLGCHIKGGDKGEKLPKDGDVVAFETFVRKRLARGQRAATVLVV